MRVLRYNSATQAASTIDSIVKERDWQLQHFSTLVRAIHVVITECTSVMNIIIRLMQWLVATMNQYGNNLVFESYVSIFKALATLDILTCMLSIVKR